jgi:hypothetical protein
MKRIILIAVFLIIVIFQGFSQTKNFIDQPYIETMARVDTLVTPDRISLNIIITEKDTKGKTSVEELESKMESTLKNLGINTQKDLSLNDLASNFKKYLLKKQDVLKSKSYTLIVKNALMAGKVIIALEKIEISNVNIDKTEFSEIEKLKLELKSKAIIKAKKQALHMSHPLNQKVGRAIFISDLSTPIGRSLQGKVSGISIRGYSSKKEEQYKPAEIQFEKIKVESIVSVKFETE